MLVTDAIDIMQGNNFQLLILAANKHDSRWLFQPNQHHGFEITDG